MSLERLVSMLALGLLGCGGATAAAEAPSTSQLTPGQQCLEDAAAPREPNPSAPSRMVLRHILVRHAELSDPRGATRSAEQACLRALEALTALEAGSSWENAVATYSDSNDDELGRVAHDQLSPRFADAAFALEVNQLSYVVESDRGFHVILRQR